MEKFWSIWVRVFGSMLGLITASVFTAILFDTKTWWGFVLGLALMAAVVTAFGMWIERPKRR